MMLAQSFKPADELDITESQRDALCKTLVLLETGKLVHVNGVNGWYPDQDIRFTGHFSMSQWNSRVHDCGTVACIGGTAELVGGISMTPQRYGSPLFRLFHPDIPELLWGAITPSQAATALRSYLTTGDAKWHEAVA